MGQEIIGAKEVKELRAQDHCLFTYEDVQVAKNDETNSGEQAEHKPNTENCIRERA